MKALNERHKALELSVTLLLQACLWPNVTIIYTVLEKVERIF